MMRGLISGWRDLESIDSCEHMIICFDRFSLDCAWIEFLDVNLTISDEGSTPDLFRWWWCFGTVKPAYCWRISYCCALRLLTISYLE